MSFACAIDAGFDMDHAAGAGLTGGHDRGAGPRGKEIES